MRGSVVIVYVLNVMCGFVPLICHGLMHLSHLFARQSDLIIQMQSPCIGVHVCT